jgi:hypothetical protein
LKKKGKLIAAIIAFAVTAVLLMGSSGCGDNSSSNNIRKQEQSVVARQQSQYAKAQPIPFFDWSVDKDTLTQIYRLRNNANTTYSVVTTQGTGHVQWVCPSRGYPIPADTQLTNPEQAIGRGDTGLVNIPQAEPNGLYSSTNTDGTWVLCVRLDGSVAPVYTEQKVTAFSFEVDVTPDGTITDKNGKSSAAVQIHTTPPPGTPTTTAPTTP